MEVVLKFHKVKFFSQGNEKRKRERKKEEEEERKKKKTNLRGPAAKTKIRQ